MNYITNNFKHNLNPHKQIVNLFFSYQNIYFKKIVLNLFITKVVSALKSFKWSKHILKNTYLIQLLYMHCIS